MKPTTTRLMFLLAGLLLIPLVGCQKDDEPPPTSAEPTEQAAKPEASAPKPAAQTARRAQAASSPAEPPRPAANASDRPRCMLMVKEIAVCTIKADGSTDAEVRNLVAASRRSPEDCQSSLQALAELAAPLGCEQ